MAQWVNAEEGKKWNLKLENEDGSKIDPAMSMADDTYELKQFNSLTLIVKVTVF